LVGALQEHGDRHLLDLSWTEAATPQWLFLVGILGTVGLCARELHRLWLQYRFPISHPLMRALGAYGNPVTVMGGINTEVEHNLQASPSPQPNPTNPTEPETVTPRSNPGLVLQGSAINVENALILTDSWIVHMRECEVEVSFIPVPFLFP
jgi:hypothetical protein